MFGVRLLGLGPPALREERGFVFSAPGRPDVLGRPRTGRLPSRWHRAADGASALRRRRKNESSLLPPLRLPPWVSPRRQGRGEEKRATSRPQRSTPHSLPRPLLLPRPRSPLTPSPRVPLLLPRPRLRGRGSPRGRGSSVSVGGPPRWLPRRRGEGSTSWSRTSVLGAIRWRRSGSGGGGWDVFRRRLRSALAPSAARCQREGSRPVLGLPRTSGRPGADGRRPTPRRSGRGPQKQTLSVRQHASREPLQQEG